MLVETQDAPPISKLTDGKYTVKFVETEEELDKVLKLRFEVFNIELGEGLDKSYETGRDEDEFDIVCHHLMVTNDETGEVVGTYRMLTWEEAKQANGFYSAFEFDFSKLPREVLENGMELGRACIARDHRNLKVLYLLWKGLAIFQWWKKKRYLFGCASLTSQDANEGRKAICYLKGQKHLHRSIFIYPKAGLECYEGDPCPEQEVFFDLPKLFKIYLTFGAKVCSAPAMDRYFKTIDFFMLFDLEDLDEKNYKFFFDFLKDLK